MSARKYAYDPNNLIDPSENRLKPIIFLDIDGVLNNHNYNNECESCTVDSHCMHILNMILRVTDARIVISSAWRYIVSGGAMNLDGFNYLMRTHGMLVARDATGKPVNRIIDFTCSDEIEPLRGNQIQKTLDEMILDFSYVILDDATSPSGNPGDHSMYLSLIEKHAGKFVRVQGHIGLTEYDANRAIELIKFQETPESRQKLFSKRYI